MMPTPTLESPTPVQSLSKVFKSLPWELVIVLLENMPYHTLVSLRQVNRQFSRLITIRVLADAHARLAFQLERCEQHQTEFPAYLVEITEPYREYFFKSDQNNVETDNGPRALSTPTHPDSLLRSKSLPGTAPGTLLHSLPKYRNATDDLATTPQVLPLSYHGHLHPPLLLPLTVPCYSCLLLLPATHFSPRQISNKRRPGGSDCARRCCCDCATFSGKWQGGTYIGASGHWLRRYHEYNWVVRIICVECNVFVNDWTINRKNCLTGRLCAKCRKNRYLNLKANLSPTCRAWQHELQARGIEARVWIRKLAEESWDMRSARPSANRNASIVFRTDLEKYMRVGRCQRCWAIDHTEREPKGKVDGRPLCEQCLSLALINTLEVCIV